MIKQLDKDRLQMYTSVTRITIIICWLSLFTFWAIKLFGYNSFEIIANNPKFAAFSNYVQNSWLAYLSSFITTYIAKYLTFGAICQKFVFKGREAILINALIISIWAVVNFLNIDFLNMWYAYILMVIIGILYHKGWKKVFGLIAILCDFAFSTISIITRSIELHIVTDYLLGYILLIDMYFMYALYYLYSNLIRLKKEK